MGSTILTCTEQAGSTSLGTAHPLPWHVQREVPHLNIRPMLRGATTPCADQPANAEKSLSEDRDLCACAGHVLASKCRGVSVQRQESLTVYASWHTWFIYCHIWQPYILPLCLNRRKQPEIHFRSKLHLISFPPSSCPSTLCSSTPPPAYYLPSPLPCSPPALPRPCAGPESQHKFPFQPAY